MTAPTPTGPDTNLPPTPMHNPLEKRRMLDGPITPGEQPGKRTNEERNDPEAEPGAGQGKAPAGPHTINTPTGKPRGLASTLLVVLLGCPLLMLIGCDRNDEPAATSSDVADDASTAAAEPAQQSPSTTAMTSVPEADQPLPPPAIPMACEGLNGDELIACTEREAAIPQEKTTPSPGATLPEPR